MDDFIVCRSHYSKSIMDGMSFSDFHNLAVKVLPRKLYKYFPNQENSDGENYSIQALINNTVHLSSPLGFDDPYDSSLTVDYEAFRMRRLGYYAKTCGFQLDKNLDYHGAIFELSKYIWTAINNGIQPETIFGIMGDFEDCLDLNKNVFLQTILSVLYADGDKPDAWQKAFERAFEQEFKNVNEFLSSQFIIACFATDPYSIRMWSHYANNHKGFCIEYSVPAYSDETSNIQDSLFPVIYSDYRTSILEQCNSFLNMQEISDEILWDVFRYGLLSKSSMWKEQDEWRLLSLSDMIPCDDNNNCVFFPISKVFLGAKMDAETRMKIIDICKARSIPCSGVVMRNDRYQLYDCESLCENCAKVKEKH